MHSANWQRLQELNQDLKISCNFIERFLVLYLAMYVELISNE